MNDFPTIPAFGEMATIFEFVTELRVGIFDSQKAAGRFANRDRSVISRYENGYVQPPIGYVAALAEQFFITRGRLLLEPLSTTRYQQAVLKEVNQAVSATYQPGLPFRDWDELSECARRFLAGEDAPSLLPSSPLPKPKSNIRQLLSWSQAPDVARFEGRTTECTTLQEWIMDDHCRLIGVLGMGGVGKTLLTTKVMTETAANFGAILWRSLRKELPLDALLTDLIHSLSGVQPTASTNTLADQLLELLRQRRTLILLDNLESLLQTAERVGNYRSGFEEYRYFFQMIGETEHQSCVLITSREKPAELARLEGMESPVRVLHLQGVDTVTARLALSDRSLQGTEAEWQKLVTHFSGNLMALQMVSETIRDLFHGQIARFLESEDLSIFHDIRELLDDQFQRLSPLERDLLYWFGIEREPTDLMRLQENLLVRTSPRDVRDAVQSLRRRSLLERTHNGFDLQTIVLDYVTQRLVDTACQEVMQGELCLLHSHALMKAQSNDYIRRQQLRLIIQPLVDRLEVLLRDRSMLTARLGSLVQSLRTTGSEQAGYAGGNFLNLLTYLNANLHCYDFSGLAVWQAYFMGKGFQDLKLAHADLRYSVFMEVLDRVRSLTYSHDGRLLAVGTTDGVIRLWQLADRRHLVTLHGHTDWVQGLAFSPDDCTLYSCSDDCSIRQWDVATGQLLQTWHTYAQAKPLAVALHPAGRVIAAGGADGFITLYTTATGRIMRTLAGHYKRVGALLFTRDGNRLVSGSTDRTIRIWDANTGDLLQILEGHTGWIWSVALSPDEETIASCGYDRTIRLWAMASGTCWAELAGHESWVRVVAFHPSGKLLASGSNDQTIRLWNSATGEQQAVLKGHTGQPWALKFSNDGKTLISGSDDRTVRLWDVESYQPLQTLYGHNGRINTVAASRNGHLVAGAGEDGIIRIWCYEQMQLLHELTGHQSRIFSLAFSPDGQLLVSGSGDMAAKVWDVQSGRCLLTLHQHTGSVTRAVFSPDGEMIATSSLDTTVCLWNLSGECIAILSDVNKIAEITALAFSPDGERIAIACENNKGWVWNIAQQTLVVEFTGHSAQVWDIVFDQSGQQAITGSSDGSICCWDATNGELLQTIQAHPDQVKSVAISPNNQWIASSSYDHTIRLWDTTTNTLWTTLTGHCDVVFSVRFISDTLLLSGSQDETMRIWDIASGQCLQVLRPDRIYERMNITGVTGITEAQKASLKALGAITD